MTQLRIPPRTAASLGAAALLLWCTSASAEGLPFEQQLSLGKPTATTTVRASNTPAGVELSFGTARHTLEQVQGTAVDVETITLQGGGVVGVLSVQTASGTYLALAGKKRGKNAVIWSGSGTLHGDPGERRGYALIQADRDGDGTNDVGIVERHERAHRCAGAAPWIRARWINPVTLDLEPPSLLVEAPPDASLQNAVPVLATMEAPTGIDEHPRVQVLRTRWSTSSALGDALGELPTGGGLIDRDAVAPWDGGLTESARAVFGILGSGLHVRQLALTLATGSNLPHGGQLHLRGDSGNWFHVTLPATTGSGGRYWITLPEPTHWTCMEVAAVRVGDRFQPVPPLSEIEVFTEADATDGIAQLVGRVVTDDRNGGEAANLLASLGETGITALNASWERLGPRGQRRAVAALADRAGTSAAARATLAVAATSTDGDLASRALSALTRAKDPAFPELAKLAANPGNIGIQAALAIGESGHSEAVQTLLALLVAAGGSERVAVRQALTIALSRLGPESVSQVNQWLAGEVPVPALAASLTVLAANQATREVAGTAWQRLIAQPLEFPEAWRAILASRALAPSAAVDQWLVTQAAAPGVTWMLREAALTSLQARNSELALGAAEQARDDESPRVRAAAIAVIGSRADRRAALAAGLADEQWPLARVAILNQVGGLPDSSTILTGRLRDPALRVRIAAVEGLTQAGARDAWPMVAKRLQDNNEWPAVMAAAIQFAGALCITDATSDLREVLKRGLKPNAWAPDVDLALEAITVLGRLGTDDSRRLLAAAQTPDQPPAIREAAKRAALGATCGPQGGSEPVQSPQE